MTELAFKKKVASLAHQTFQLLVHSYLPSALPGEGLCPILVFSVRERSSKIILYCSCKKHQPAPRDSGHDVYFHLTQH